MTTLTPPNPHAIVDAPDSCKQPRLPYIQWHVDAQERSEQGEKQAWCKTCQRWKWPDLQCEIAEVNDDRRP